MKYNLKFKDIDKTVEFENTNLRIKDVLNELDLSSQIIVVKQNGEVAIEESVINDGDEIKLIQIIYGG